MPRKIINFNLDLFEKNILPVCNLKQYDECTLNISLKKNGEVYNCTGSSAVIYISCDDDVFKQNTNITVMDSTVIVTLKKEMLQKYGKALGEIELTNSEGVITTTTFILEIDGKIGEGSTLPGGIEGFVALHERLIREFKAEYNAKILELQNKDTQIDLQIESINKKNIEQDNNIKTIEDKNKHQDVILGGLLNENTDKRLSVTTEGNDIKLINSKNGLVEVNNIVGNTLVNLVSTDKIGLLGSTSSQTKDTVKLVQENTAEEFSLTTVRELEGDTTFYIIYTILESTLSTDSLVIKGGYKNVSNSNVACKSTVGTHVVSFTSNSSNNGRYVRFAISSTEQDGNYVVLSKNIMLIMGDSMLTPVNYFKGIQSAFDENIVTQEQVSAGTELAENLDKYKIYAALIGKNKHIPHAQNGDYVNVILENNEIFINGTGTSYMDYRIAHDGISGGLPNTVISTRDLLNTAPVGTSYTLSNNLGLNNYFRVNRDGSETYLNNTWTKQKDDVLISCFVRIPDNTPYSKVKLNIQLEEGMQSTPYEPYYEKKVAVYTNTPVLKGDVIETRSDGVYHVKNWNKAILNNNNNISLNGNVGSYHSFIFNDVVGSTNQLNIISLSFATRTGDVEHIRLSATSGKVIVNIESTKLSTQDVEGFKKWLQANQILIVYELAEPIEEKISDNKFMIEIPNNATLTWQSNIPVTSTSCNYTGSVPSVLAMYRSISDIENHNIDMVATTFDMDYRLLEVEWALEDAGIRTPVTLFKNLGGNTMALTRYEQAKIMIIGGSYNKEILTRQLTRYLEKNIITKSEYDELVSLMEAKELVAGE